MGAKLLVSLTCSIVTACGNEVSAPNRVVPSEVYSLAAMSPTELTGLVGSTLEGQPAVVVRNSRGETVSGIEVAFAVTGEGSIANPATGEASLGASFTYVSIKSDSLGVARANWSIGRRRGENVVRAQAGLSQIKFALQSFAGPVRSMQKIDGDAQLVSSGAAAVVKPRVMVSDVYANPLRGIPVTFAVISGGGSVTGATTLTDSSGIATLESWTMGTAGTQAVSASTPGIADAIFSASLFDVAHACGTSVTIPLEIGLQLALDSSSCIDAGGSRFDVLTVNLPQGALLISAASSDFDTQIELVRNDPIASNDDFGASSDSRIKAILVGGIYTVRITAKEAGKMGQYSIKVSRTADVVSGCETVHVERGISIYQMSSSAVDCSSPLGGFDSFRTYLKKGRVVDIEVEDLSYSDHFLFLKDASQTTVATGIAGSSWWILSLTYVPPADGYYAIEVGSSENGAESTLSIR